MSFSREIILIKIRRNKHMEKLFWIIQAKCLGSVINLSETKRSFINSLYRIRRKIKFTNLAIKPIKWEVKKSKRNANQ